MSFPAFSSSALGALLLIAPPAPAVAAVPVQGAQVVRAYPHDAQAFTEGLFYQDGFLYESTGLNGRSSIRKVRLETGEIIQRIDQPTRDFGEGVVAWKGRLVQLTWQSGIGYVYDLASFKPESSFRYPGEGWALTQDGRRLIMSDGTPSIRFLDPDTLKETGRIQVTADGQPVDNLNELEWVKGEIWANVWMTRRIARIDPASGRVKGWIDLSDLVEATPTNDEDAVLNGIAYDAADDRIFVTGKLWPKLYEVTLLPPR